MVITLFGKRKNEAVMDDKSLMLEGLLSHPLYETAAVFWSAPEYIRK